MDADGEGRAAPSVPERLLINHEWVAPIGGSENVFRALLETFPDADALCLWNEVPETFNRPIAESRLARSQLRGRKAQALPFMPRVWRHTDLEGYDAVLSSSHAFGHHLAGHAARTGRAAFAYVHTPARYIWAPGVESRGESIAVRTASVPLKRADRKAIDSRVHYAANSAYIGERIRRCWGADSTVIHPPIAVERISAVPCWRDELAPDEASLFESLPTEGFILGASRLVSYKRLDLVIDLGNALGLPVVIAGSGPDEEILRNHAMTANVPVVFVGRVSDEQLYALYQEALLLAFLAIEDFGIMPVECMAAGTPVLVNKVGGAPESVRLTRGGLAADPTAGLAALTVVARAALELDRTNLKAATAKYFGEEVFRAQIRAWYQNRP